MMTKEELQVQVVKLRAELSRERARRIDYQEMFEAHKTMLEAREKDLREEMARRRVLEEELTYYKTLGGHPDGHVKIRTRPVEV